MSVQLCFDLKRDTLKAQIVPQDQPDLIYLIDTGADIPVWCKGEVELRDVFSDAKLTEPKCLLSGFGRYPELVDVYKLPQFRLTDGEQSIEYQNLAVAVCNRPETGIDLILPASIFNHMQILVDRMTSNVYPTVTITAEKERVPVFLRQRHLTEKQKQELGIKSGTILHSVYAEVDG